MLENEVLVGSDETVSQMLSEVNGSAIEVSWQRKSFRQRLFRLTLPYNCFASGTIVKRQGYKELYINSFAVNDQLKRNGIGSRLFRTMVDIGGKEHVSTIYGDVMSKEMLKTMASVLGPDNLKFFAIPDDYPNGYSPPVKISYNEAVANFTGLRVEARLRRGSTNASGK